jgi:Papain family cysteine protease
MGKTRRPAATRFSRLARWAPALLTLVATTLAAAPLVWAGPPTPPPVPTSIFGIPIPSALPSSLPPLPYWSPERVLVLPGSNEPLNVPFLQQLLKAKPEGCGVTEVAPGQYVKIDCRPYAQMLGAVQEVLDISKLDIFQRGQLPAPPVGPGPAPEPSHGGSTTDSDHRTMGLEGPIKDQGLVGNCSAFSLSSAIDNAILRMHHTDVISPLHIWSHYGNSDMGQAGDSNLNRLLALNQTLPYSAKQACELVRDASDECGRLLGVTPASASSDAALQTALQRAEQSGVYRITSISRFTQRPNINVDAIAAVLSTGQDVWGGFDIDVASWKSTSQVNNVIRDWGSTNAGHAVTLAGYRQAPGGGGRQFLIHNSWGGRWGDHGFAWVNEAMVKQHFQVAYKVTVAEPAK